MDDCCCSYLIITGRLVKGIAQEWINDITKEMPVVKKEFTVQVGPA